MYENILWVGAVLSTFVVLLGIGRNWLRWRHNPLRKWEKTIRYLAVWLLVQAGLFFFLLPRALDEYSDSYWPSIGFFVSGMAVWALAGFVERKRHRASEHRTRTARRT